MLIQLCFVWFITQWYSCAHVGRLYPGNHFGPKQAGSRLRQVSRRWGLKKLDSKWCETIRLKYCILKIKCHKYDLIYTTVFNRKHHPLSLRLMAIQQCELVLLHIYPQGEDTLVSDRPKKEVRADLKTQHLLLDLITTENVTLLHHSRLQSSLHSSLAVSDFPSAHQWGSQCSCWETPGHQTQHSGPAALWFGLHHHYKHSHEGKCLPAI